MNLYRGLSGEALALVREHQDVVDRLPRTFLVNTLTEIEKWPTLFDPEQAYFRALFAELAALDASDFRQVFGSLADFEARTGCDRVKGDGPEVLQSRLLNHLQRQGQYAAWRREIDALFQRLEPRVEARLNTDRAPRLVVILYEEGIAIERETLWKRFRSLGTRVPLDLAGAQARDPFVRALFTGRPPGDGSGATLFEVLSRKSGFTPLSAWILEAGDSLCSLREQAGHSDCATGLSYARLRAYRERLAEAIYTKVTSGGVRGPQELAAWMKTLELDEGGKPVHPDPKVAAFTRDILLSGSGTLIINNTFVEWGAVQALRRVQPQLVVARFGVRDKMKPFSSLLLFSKPRPTDQIPILQDPLGSFIDVELLSYYIWLNAEEVPANRQNTLYLLLADGVDEMMAVLPASRQLPAPRRATLMDVAATMAHRLGVQLPGSPGKPIWDI
jgi:hypothetical protein